jgi:hypothetical protein
MHGVAPQMCDRVACPLLGRGAGGRSPGFLYRPWSIFQRLKRALDLRWGTVPCRGMLACFRPHWPRPATKYSSSTTVRVSEFLKRSPKLGQPVLEFPGVVKGKCGLLTSELPSLAAFLRVGRSR